MLSSLAPAFLSFGLILGIWGTPLEPLPGPEEQLKGRSPAGLFINGKRTFRKQVLENLQQITDYPLDFLFGSGKVVIAGNPAVVTRPVGNALLIQLVQSSEKVEIIRSEDGRNHFYPYSPTRFYRKQAIGGLIHFNPYNLRGGKTVEGGERRPAHIGLAHELLHAFHCIHGMADLHTVPCSETGPGEDPLTYEELVTRVKENVIRAEQEIAPRAIPDACIALDSLRSGLFLLREAGS